MGLFTHLAAFGAGLYIGARHVSAKSRQEPFIEIDSSGVKVGNNQFIKNDDEQITIGDGIFKIKKRR